MAHFELHGRSYSSSDTFVKPAFSRASTRTTFSRSSPHDQELPRLDVKSVDAMSVVSCPSMGGSLASRGGRNSLKRQVMSADSAPFLERQYTGVHNAHLDMSYSNDRPQTKQEYKPATATVPKKGLIKLTALDYELRNPDIFRQKTFTGSSQNAGAKSGKSTKGVTKKSSSRQLGLIKESHGHVDIPTMWGAIQRQCTTVGDFKKSILEFSGDALPDRPILHSFHTTLGTWDPSTSVYIPGNKTVDTDEPS